MTNPLNGEPIKTPSQAAVAEHLVTIPMAFAVLALILGGITAAGYFEPDAPTQKLLLYITAGLPLLCAQLGQMWHSRNVRNKIAVANGTTPTEAPPEAPRP